MSILFINGSPNKNGNTAALAAELLKNKEYETLNLTGCTIGAYGQNLPGDGLDAVIEAMKQADTIVIGSPLYWHNICGSVRNVPDRFYGKVESGELSGRKLYFVFQGAAPENWMLEAGEYTMKRFAAQIILRWHIQCGTIVIPGSKNPEHIRSNFALFNFALTESEMAEIAALDKNQLYYIRTPELLKKYAEMIPPVDEQK